MRKKKVAIWTDFPTSNTGLARNGRALLKHLYKTGKYEISYYATGISWSNPDAKKLPVYCRGTCPDDAREYESLRSDPQKMRDSSYGGPRIEQFLKETKPDVLICSNDSWAFPHYNKPWWKKINVVPHITLDSLPFLDEQIKMVEKSPKFYVWAKFAKEELEKKGHQNIDLIPAIIEDEYFYPLEDSRKKELRKKFKLDDTFIVGFVFRSQPRKEVMPLLQGFAQFKKEHPNVKAKLLLHTNFSEGWDIPRLMKEAGVDKDDILTTYVCRNCGEYEIKPFDGQDKDCPFCEMKKSQITTNTYVGVNQSQLNEIYNLMDCYCHLANAGGCEMPIIEALYAGLPLGTVSYTFGKTFTDESFVSEIDCAYRTDPQSLFSRAVPNPYSVSKFIKKIHNLDAGKRKEIGRKGREFAMKTFSPEVVGKKWEEVIDGLPLVEDYDYSFEYHPKNPQYVPPQGLSDNDFLTALYDNMLFQPEPMDGDGRKHWLGLLSKGVKREDVYKYFVKVATEDNLKNQKVELTELFPKDKKICLFVSNGDPEEVYHVCSLLKSAKETYPSHEIYFAVNPKSEAILEGNPYVSKVLNYSPIFENEFLMTGNGDNPKVVDVVIVPKRNLKPVTTKCQLSTYAR